MIKCGSKYEEISDRIGRSVKAIRGRVFDKYLTENLDKVRNYIGNGNFGDGTPDKPLKYKRLMSDEEKTKLIYCYQSSQEIYFVLQKRTQMLMRNTVNIGRRICA